ncbi:tetratricopeptide repeat protein [Sphingobacterium psychroaquaticum]|nr:tetratricopeptide repeat protein [Sphingobacterium psychroaquaticum]QBQ43043.1 tetratricopeptide repeat protein [Sphingobacterium psychroaquaticum]
MKKTVILGLLVSCSFTGFAQSNYKESSNSFAMYMQSGDLKNLESAKKFNDAGYQNKRDSTSAKVNVLRAMIYSAMAYADSSRTIKNPKDPIDITYHALGKLRANDLQNYPAEMKYVKQNLAAAHISSANKALGKKDYKTAYDNYIKVKELSIGNTDVIYNLALLAVQSKQYKEAIGYYTTVIKDDDATATMYLELADVYRLSGDKHAQLRTLETARSKFKDNKVVLMNLIQELAHNNNYEAIVPIIDEAIKFEPENVELNYLAGYANETVGRIDIAKRYYQKTLQLSPNNYEANLALGLIFLGDFLKNDTNVEAQYYAQNLLLKANEIRPYDVNALKSLSMYYEKAGDLAQLDRVKLLLNQLSNN